MAKVRVTLLGCGGFMGQHVNRLRKRPDVEIVGLCDVTQEQLDKFTKRHWGNDGQPATPPPTFTDRAKMYAKTKPDAVFVATPHTLHYEHAVEALAAGCHVYMEKPMVTKSADAYALAEHVKKAGKILVVGYNTSCSPRFAYLRDVIRSGELGKLEMVSGYLTQDWRRFTKGSWRQKPELSGGGQAYDSGAHLLNSLCWTVDSPIAEVSAFVDNLDTPVDINSVINVRFTNGVLAAILVSGNSPGAGTHTVFVFDGGRVEVDGWGAHWMRVYKGDGKGGDKQIEVELPQEQMTPDDNFLDAIQGKAKPRTSPQHGIIHTELMDAIYESARTGKPAKPKRK